MNERPAVNWLVLPLTAVGLGGCLMLLGGGAMAGGIFTEKEKKAINDKI